MTPTHRNEEIEGRSYKEYGYSPVPASSSSAVYDSTTPGKDSVELSVKCNGDQRCGSGLDFRAKCRADEMTEKGSKFLQYFAAAAGNLCIVAAGAMMAWTSPVLPMLKLNSTMAPDNPLVEPINEDQSSWIGSLVAVGTLFGSFAAGYCGERFGRKRSLLFSAIPFLVGWILIGTATHVEQLYVARLILGFAMAYPFTILPMYVGEIAETSIRGALGSFLQLFITIGLLYSYAIGPFVSYTVLWLLCACLPILFFLSFMTMPESPYYLLGKNDKEAAVASLARLRGKSSAAVQKEADEMQAKVEEAQRARASVMDLFTVKANFKALLYTCALVSFQQLTGVNVVLFYMTDIFKSAGTSLDPAISTIIVGVVQMLASCVTPLVVDRLGRRMLLVLSGVGAAVSCGALGLYYYLKQVEGSSVVDSISWLPVLSLVVFISTYSVGWGPLPWAVMGEMFSSTVKAKASGITVCVCWFLAFLITKYSSAIQINFGNYTSFWFFGICCVVSVLFTILLLPETKGKTLQQIQDELNGVKPVLSEFDGLESATKN
ncbi:hypothetical protein KM043_004048 [Ampulex compressa]|nr:hypothetical protein KM043_004048 [Ampulex compressa]